MSVELTGTQLIMEITIKMANSKQLILQILKQTTTEMLIPAVTVDAVTIAVDKP